MKAILEVLTTENIDELKIRQRVAWLGMIPVMLAFVGAIWLRSCDIIVPAQYLAMSIIVWIPFSFWLEKRYSDFKTYLINEIDNAVKAQGSNEEEYF